MKYIPIKLTARPSIEIARASEEDLDKKDLTKAELDQLFLAEPKGDATHEQSNTRTN